MNFKRQEGEGCIRFSSISVFMQIGFHIPFSGNLKRMANQTHLSRGNCFQFFSRGSRGKDLPTVKDKQINNFYNFLFEKKISNIIMHSPYTFNLALKNEEVVSKILEDLNHAKRVLANYYVINPGYAVNQTEFDSIAILKEQIKFILNETSWEGEILIRNMSGAGTQISSDLKIWNELISFHPRVKGALDFSKAFAYGYDFITEDKARNFEYFISNSIGWEKIKLLYINDYNRFCGTKKDDYVPLGDGVIGFHGYKEILKYNSLKDKVWIVENQPESFYYDRSIDFLVPFFRRTVGE